MSEVEHTIRTVVICDGTVKVEFDLDFADEEGVFSACGHVYLVNQEGEEIFHLEVEADRVEFMALPKAMP